jgi:hypothetical protein
MVVTLSIVLSVVGRSGGIDNSKPCLDSSRDHMPLPTGVNKTLFDAPMDWNRNREERFDV